MNPKMQTNLAEYYAKRAPHYEDIYQLAHRQSDLLELTERLRQTIDNRNVLEVACGTGYWTERFVGHARHIVATDINTAVLDIAKAKPALENRVDFTIADAFNLPEGDFDACVAGFWWSHVKRSDQSSFLTGVQKACGSGTLLVLFDNCYAEGDSIPIARTDLDGNTYQIRTLPDGTRHEIVKNFPTDSALRKKLGSHARDIRITRQRYFWMLTCLLR